MIGRISDRVAPKRRLVLTVPMLLLAVVALVLIGSPLALGNQMIGLTLLGVVAFLLIGPYSLLAGAVAVDLGARRGSATAAGLIDSAGYVGAVLSGWGIGALTQTAGWTVAFRTLAGVAAGALLSTLVYWWLERSTGETR
jgi:OPA family glycerol-3-phosphate transporter-like MFS transporter